MNESIILPGKTIGILGGGQLGRMSILAGKTMGYHFVVWEPAGECPAKAVADYLISAPYEDKQALEQFISAVDVVTVEFENIPPSLLEVIEASGLPVRPKASVLATCQNRYKEKTFLRQSGFPCAPFELVQSAKALASAVQAMGVPCVLKSADFGYDGKGQVKIETLQMDFEALWESFGYRAGVLEAWMNFASEASVVVARNFSGTCEVFPVASNLHVKGVLHKSSVPATYSSTITSIVKNRACAIADKLQVVGLLGVEFFIQETEGGVYVNELAPRAHNSAHWSLEASNVSQFEQHIRAVCGLPLSSVELLKPAVMVNLLGELWKEDSAAYLLTYLEKPDVYLHLYGKKEARVGRKMGHFTVLSNELTQAENLAESLWAKISTSSRSENRTSSIS